MFLNVATTRTSRLDKHNHELDWCSNVAGEGLCVVVTVAVMVVTGSIAVTVVTVSVILITVTVVVVTEQK